MFNETTDAGKNSAKPKMVISNVLPAVVVVHGSGVLSELLHAPNARAVATMAERNSNRYNSPPPLELTEDLIKKPLH